MGRKPRFMEHFKDAIDYRTRRYYKKRLENKECIDAYSARYIKAIRRDKMKIYNKLIRDRIPKIIENGGNASKVRALNEKEYLQELNKKLVEELKEYQESGELEELADVMEIIYAIAEYKGSSIEEFEKIRKDKREKRGGFEKRLFLESLGE